MAADRLIFNRVDRAINYLHCALIAVFAHTEFVVDLMLLSL